MSLYVDEKYLMHVAYQLRNFRKKSDYLWNFSCPLCGDSKKNKIRARAYVFRIEDHFAYKCHNCGCATSFSDFLRRLDDTMYKEYVRESFIEARSSERESPAEKREKVVKKFKKEYKPAKPTVLIGCPSIATLGPDHPARAYIENRKIPKKFWEELFWTDDFPALVDKVNPDNQFETLRKEGRIVIPFFDRQHQVMTIQGRSLEPEATIRYITIKAFEDAPRIYGMNRLQITQRRIYVVEGPFDSLFLPNCVAMAGSDIPLDWPVDRTVIVYDNEPRKKETVVKIEKAIDRGFQVCIWPDTMKLKDINLMILEGYSESSIRGIIDNNTYTGLLAKAKLQHWSNPKGNRKDGKPQHSH